MVSRGRVGGRRRVNNGLINANASFKPMIDDCAARQSRYRCLVPNSDSAQPDQRERSFRSDSTTTTNRVTRAVRA